MCLGGMCILTYHAVHVSHQRSVLSFFFRLLILVIVICMDSVVLFFVVL